MYPLSYLFGLNWFRKGAWFEPSTDAQIRDANTLLALKGSDRVAELGAGDGRAVIEFASSGAKVVGFEKDARLVEIAQEKITQLKLGNAKMVTIDFWKENLAIFNKIYIYQFHTVMPALETKLMMELPDGALVASNTWKFPHWDLVRSLGAIHLYTVNKS